MVKRKIGAHQRELRRYEIDLLLGKKVETIFLINTVQGVKQISVIDVLEKRDSPPSQNGYYLKVAGIHLCLNYSKVRRQDGKRRIYVEDSKPTRTRLREIGRLEGALE